MRKGNNKGITKETAMPQVPIRREKELEEDLITI